MTTLRQRLLPLALAAFAVAYMVEAWRIPLDPWSAAEAVTARTLPLLYGIGLLAVSVALLFAPPPTGAAPAPERTRRWLPLLGHSIAIAAFGFLIGYAGLWVATALLLLAGLLIAGERRVAVLAAAPIATAATAWFLIAVVLDVYISPGAWFS